MHAGRGVLGFILLKKLPASHTILSNIKVSSGSKKVPFEEITKHVVKTGQEAFVKFKNDVGKILLVAYAGLTAGSFIIDLVAFFIQAARFNHDRTAFADTTLLAMSCVFICCDLYYVIWMVASASKFPVFMQKFVLLGLVGIFAGVTLAMH